METVFSSVSQRIYRIVNDPIPIDMGGFSKNAEIGNKETINCMLKFQCFAEGTILKDYYNNLYRVSKVSKRKNTPMKLVRILNKEVT